LITMPKVRLDHCVIRITEWERSNAFYRDVLGAEVSKRGDGWCYRIGDMQINCHGPGVTAAGVRIEAGATHLCFEWPGPIGAAKAHLDKHGVAVELGPVERSGTHGLGTSLYFRDPDGALLEFMSYAAAG
jgi:catechol 2,3-dioxygenase-like lactoylglutathione lyase family enzyme